MIPGLPPISVYSAPFAAIALAIVLLAWSPWRSWFLYGLTLGSAIVLFSWLTPASLLLFALFLMPPYVLVRLIQGSGRLIFSRISRVVIVWQIILFVYLRKYEWAGELEWLDHPIAIIGLSYMLFRVIHLIIEAPSLGRRPVGPVHYVTYVIAFWTLLSGPIQRYEAFCSGLNNIGYPGNDVALQAGHRAVNGLIKAFLLAPVFLKAADFQTLSSANAGWLDLAIVFYGYPIYLYLNFSGYTDFMIGIAKLCGVSTLPENFNRPYLARNVTDFWARWHMSFGTWIRDYVFTPMSKYLLAHTSPCAHNAMLAISVVVTFLVVGAWHGTTLNFLIFGLCHGAAIIVATVYGHILKSILGRKGRNAFEQHPIVHVLSVVLCFHFVAGTILLFPNSAGDVWQVLSQFFASQG